MPHDTKTSDIKNDLAVRWKHEDGSERELQYKDDDLEYVGTIAAEDFYNNCDGWESSWPQTFLFYNSDDEFLGAVEVDMEMEPTFCNAQKMEGDEESFK